MSEFSAVVDNLKENNEQTESLIALQEQEADAVTAAGGKSARDAAAVEESRENARSQNKIIAALQGMKESIGNLGQSFSDSVKDKAKAFGGNIVGVLKKLLIGGALAAFIAFMNSEYWEKTKKVIVEDIVPALVSVYENVLQPLFTVIKDVFIKQWENIKVLFDGIGEAITKFKEGDILGGITGLIGSLGTFFMDTIDNLITGVFNLFAGLFGLEGTDSVFGSIGKFISDTWNSITGFFTDLYNASVELFTGFIDSVIGGVKDIFALGEDLFGDFALFQFVKQTVGDVIKSIKALFSGDFSLQTFLDLFGSVFDIITYPISAGINLIKDIFKFGDPNEPFRLSDFVIETFAKIGEFFKNLLNIDVRGLASGILPETVVDFLFGKEVDQSSDEFKSMSALDQAQATGLYDKDLIGKSELNQNLLGQASDAQLQAILDDDDISEENVKAIKAEQAKRSSAGEFSGSGRFQEKQYLLPKEYRSGQYAFRGSEEYEDIISSLNPAFKIRKRVKLADFKYTQQYGNPNLSPAGGTTGTTVAQGTDATNEATSDANTTDVIQQNNNSGGGGGSQTVAMPVTTKDNSTASQLAAVAG